MSKSIQKQEEFKCPSCASSMKHDSSSLNLNCSTCGYVENACQQNSENVVFDLTAAENDLALQDWGYPVRTVICSDCKGKFIITAAEGNLNCPFCASQHISVLDEAPGVRPDSIIPFKVDKDNAHERVSEWITKRYLAPFPFKSEYTSDRLNGIYLPYWSFDAQVDAAYTGQVANSYTDTEIDTVTSDERTDTKKHKVKKMRWRFVTGAIDRTFKNVIFNDAGKPDAKTIERIEPFKLNELVSFSPKYLTGYAVLHYKNGLEAMWEHAQSYMGDTVRDEVHRTVKRGADVVGAVNTCVTYSKITFRQLLLPVWIVTYRYKNKSYHIYINGQTGMIFGDSPYSVLKIGIIALAAAAVIGALIIFL